MNRDDTAAIDSNDIEGGRDAWAREVLADSGFDAELGLAAARDAQLVVAGELSEAEFRERYNAPYLGEFGVDARPSLDSGLAPPVRETTAAPLSNTVAVDDTTPEALPTGDSGEQPLAASLYEELPLVSRRAALGAVAGAAIGALFFSDLFRQNAHAQSVAGTAAGTTTTKPAGGGVAPPGKKLPVQFGMVIDLERCDGCLECVSACSDSNGLSQGSLWAYVMAYKEPENTDPNFLVRLCQHCTRAPCVMVCPTGARHRRLADGLVLTDYDVCIGCRYCQVACPYGVNVFQWADPLAYGGTYSGPQHDARGVAVVGDPPRGVMGKCTFCPTRQDDPQRRGTASCVSACNMNALHIGDLNDPNSAPNVYLAQRRAQAGGNLQTFRLLEDLGTDPNIIYIGRPPSPRAELVDGPFTLGDWGLTDDRRAVLEGPKPWFERVTREA